MQVWASERASLFLTHTHSHMNTKTRIHLRSHRRGRGRGSRRLHLNQRPRICIPVEFSRPGSLQTTLGAGEVGSWAVVGRGKKAQGEAAYLRWWRRVGIPRKNGLARRETSHKRPRLENSSTTERGIELAAAKPANIPLYLADRWMKSFCRELEQQTRGGMNW